MSEPWSKELNSLQNGERTYCADVIEFLEERPRHFRSGYVIERMLRFASRPQWTADERERIVAVARRIAASGPSREATEAERLLTRLHVA